MTWKFRRWTGCTIIVGLALLHATASHGAGKRFAFKGVTLGMSIGEFRDLAFPDAGRPPAGGKFVPRVYRTSCGPPMDRIERCWFEAWNESYPPVCKLDADGIERHVRKVNRTIRRWTNTNKELTVEDVDNMCFARIDVGYGGRPPEFGSDISYRFHGGRLMEIDIRVRPGDVDLLYPKLVIAYGPPTMKSMPVESNRLGAKFQNLVAEWRSDEDVIILKRYDGHTDIGQFTFIHRPTVAQYQSGTARATRDAAKDF